MKTRFLPHTDLAPSALCLGTNRLGSVIPRAEAFALLDAFLDRGGNFLDTAHIYADWIAGAPQSASEKTIGAWLTSRRKRAKVIVATKGGHPHLKSMHIPRLSPATLRQDLEASLVNLQVDVIDLYWLHRDDSAQDVGTILDTMQMFVQEGKIRYFGCSNWSVDRIQQAEDYARQHDLQGFVASQPQWSLALPNAGQGMFSDSSLQVMDQAAWDYHYQTQMAVVPYTAQARGYFSKLADDSLDGLGQEDRASFDQPANRDTFHRLQAVATIYGVEPVQIALSYLLAQPFPVYPIVGCRTLEQLDQSMRALALKLSNEDLIFLAGPTLQLPADLALP